MTKTTQALIALAALLVLALGGFVAYGNGQRKAYLEAKGAAAVLEKQYAEYQAAAGKEKAALELEAEKWRADKDAALIAAHNAEISQAMTQARLDAQLALTASLPPDALSGNINQRIGANQSWPTEGGVFTFTRPGTENVLNRFLTGEASESKYQAEAVVTVNLRAAIDAAERGTASISGQLALAAGERDRAIAAWGATGDALKHLERAQFGTKIKYAAYGAGAYFVIEKGVIPLVKLIFGIK